MPKRLDKTKHWLRCRKVLWLLPLVFLRTAGIGAADTGNLLNNPGFFGPVGSSVARHWQDNSKWADVAVSYELVRDAKEQTVQIIDCAMYKSGAVQFIQRDIAIKKNHPYRISVRMKGDIKTPIEIIIRKRNRPYTVYTRKSFRLSDEWKNHSFIGIAADDDTKAVFQVRFADTGRLFLSRAELIDITNSISPAPATKKNLMPNGGFEVGLDRWGVDFRETGGYANALAIDFSNPKPFFGRNGAIQGDGFLELNLPEKSRVKVTSSYVNIYPNRNYTISCWMTADTQRQITIGLGNGYFGTGRKFKKTCSVSQTWQKFSFSTPLAPGPDNAYFFFMETSGKGRVLLDGVCLREENADAYKPPALAEVGFSRTNLKLIRFLDDYGKLVLNAVNHTRADAETIVTFTDYWGTKHQLASFRVPGGKRMEQNIPLPSDTTGYKNIRAEIKINGDIQDASELAIAVVPRPIDGAQTGSPFGGHVKFNSEMLEYARMLGVKWLRTHPPDGTKWFVVEKNKGTFTFFDAPFQMAKKKGFHLLGLLGTSPRWASSAPDKETSEAVGSFRSYSPKDNRYWHNYVFNTVKHFKGTIDHWEIWNEPDTQFFKIPESNIFRPDKPTAYCALLKIAYDAAKIANPNSKIIGGSAVKVPLSQWTEEITEADALNSLDILSYHQYFGRLPGTSLFKSIASGVNNLKSIMGKSGPEVKKPIWNTEGGIIFTATKYRNIHEVTLDYALPPDEGPIYLIRNYVRLLGSGVEKLFFYNLFASHQIDRREGTGFFEWDGSPRPLAAAYAVLAKNIGDCFFLKYIQDNPDVTQAVFSGNSKKVTIMWRNNKSSKKKLLLPVGNHPDARFSDIMGNCYPAEIVNGKKFLDLSKYPIYMIEPV